MVIFVNLHVFGENEFLKANFELFDHDRNRLRANQDLFAVSNELFCEEVLDAIFGEKIQSK